MTKPCVIPSVIILRFTTSRRRLSATSPELKAPKLSLLWPSLVQKDGSLLLRELNAPQFAASTISTTLNSNVKSLSLVANLKKRTKSISALLFVPKMKNFLSPLPTCPTKMSTCGSGTSQSVWLNKYFRKGLPTSLELRPLSAISLQMLCWLLVPKPISSIRSLRITLWLHQRPLSTRRNNTSVATTLVTAGSLTESSSLVQIKVILYTVKVMVISNYCCIKIPKWMVSIFRQLEPIQRVSSLVETKVKF